MHRDAIAMWRSFTGNNKMKNRDVRLCGIALPTGSTTTRKFPSNKAVRGKRFFLSLPGD